MEEEEKTIEELRSVLTDKQRIFAEEYIKDLNATQAAIRSGYSEHTAYSIGGENLRKPEIENYIHALMMERSKKIGVEADEVLRHLNILRKARIDEYVNIKTVPLSKDKNIDVDELLESELEALFEQGIITYEQRIEFKDFSELTEEQLMCIESVKNTKYGIEIKLHGKEWTIEKINRHIGFYEKDNESKATKIIPPSISFYDSSNE